MKIINRFIVEPEDDEIGTQSDKHKPDIKEVEAGRGQVKEVIETETDILSGENGNKKRENKRTKERKENLKKDKVNIEDQNSPGIGEEIGNKYKSNMNDNSNNSDTDLQGEDSAGILINDNLSEEDIIKGIVFKEILAKPRAKDPYHPPYRNNS